MKDRVVFKRKTFKADVGRLTRVVASLKQQHQEQTRLQQQQQLRSDVLANLCLLLDILAHLYETHEQLQQSRPAASGQTRDQDSATQLPSSRDVLMPAFCCTADLMYKVTPQLLQSVLTLTAQDHSAGFTASFFQFAALLELINRYQSPVCSDAAIAGQGQPAGTTASAAQAAAEGQEASGLLDRQAEQRPEQGQQQQAEYMAALQQAVKTGFGVGPIAMVLNPLPLIQSVCLNHRTQQQEYPPALHWMYVARRLKLTKRQAAYLSCVYDEVALMRSSDVQQFGVLAQQVASPNPLVLAALMLQQQQEGQQQQQGQSGPAAAAAGHDSSSMGSTESSAAAANTTGAAAAGARASASASATNPALNPAAASATATMGGGGPVQVASPSSAAVVDEPPAGCVDESGLDGPGKGLKMTAHIDHMRLCTVLVAMMVFDILTPMQKANWVVASYPWMPGPMPLCHCAQQLLKEAELAKEDAPHAVNSDPGPHHRQQQQQQQQQQQDLQAPAAHMRGLYDGPDSDPHMQQCAAALQHLHDRRVAWLQRQPPLQEQMAFRFEPHMHAGGCCGGGH